MKQLLLLVFSAILLVTGCVSCDKDGDAPSTGNNNNNANPCGTKMYIKIGVHTLSFSPFIIFKSWPHRNFRVAKICFLFDA